MQMGLNQLFNNFHYGSRNFLHRLFSPRIDRLMFVATKADHITRDQIPNLVSLMRQIVQEECAIRASKMKKVRKIFRTFLFKSIT